MKVVYLIGPYRGPTIYATTRNIERARAWACSIWEQGAICICPHTNTALFDGACPDDTWLYGGVEIMSRCDGVAVMPHSDASVFSWVEKFIAENRGQPLFDLGTSQGLEAFTHWISEEPSSQELIREVEQAALIEFHLATAKERAQSPAIETYIFHLEGGLA